MVFGACCFRFGGSGAVGRRGIDWCGFLVRSSVVDVVWGVVDEVLSVESEEKDRNESKGDNVGL